MLLIVDDELGDLELLQHAFAEASPDRHITACTNATDAMVELEHFAADGRFPELIVVTDLKMPRIDGREFIEMIRERWTPGPVTIALSTSGRAGDIDAVFTAGGNAYHEKPMSYPGTVELCQRITAYWDAVLKPGASHYREETS